MNPEDRKIADAEEIRLERDLEALGKASAGIDPCEPPELLDRAVLNMARRAQPSRFRRRPLRWLGAFATAAVVVLAFSIVLQQDPQPPADPNGLRLQPMQEEDAVIRDHSAERRQAPVRESAPAPALIRKEAPASDLSAATEAPASVSADAEFAGELQKTDSDPVAEAWIERLLELSRSHRSEELVTELAAFRKAYPNYPLPPELAE